MPNDSGNYGSRTECESYKPRYIKNNVTEEKSPGREKKNERKY